ncbi:MAG: ABC transporter ATP-binding protein [Christensenellaceae bacterium]|nr:ABC transporter ATP-binding protein [Christensenellaceae bacterium]
MRETVLSLQHVTKRFGGLTAVDDVSFAVEEGEIYGLIGPNGAGKTTIFNLITGIYGLSGGEVRFYGEPLVGCKPFQIAQRGITRTFQNIRLFKKLTTYENVLTACHADADYNVFQTLFRFKVPGALGRFHAQEKRLHDKTHSLLTLMGLWDYRDMVASNLPYGLQRKLEIARALALNPKLLLLDEPAAGMNPEETLQLMRLIEEIRDAFHLTVLIIEHHMDLIMGVCERIFVLNFGKPLAEGTPEQVQNNALVVEAYLGKEGSGDDHAQNQ